MNPQPFTTSVGSSSRASLCDPLPMDVDLEALFQAGFTHYQAGHYASCFPLFRRLTEVAGRTKWANMAYFYIGMSHYNLKNWNKAIDSLSLVGTEVEESGEAPLRWQCMKMLPSTQASVLSRSSMSSSDPMKTLLMNWTMGPGRLPPVKSTTSL